MAACLTAWVAAPVAGQQNLGFESVAGESALPLAWTLGGGDEGTEIALDTATFAEGHRSLRIERTTAGITRVVQRVPAATLRAAAGEGRAARVRLEGAARTDAAGVAPALWLRIDGPGGPLYLDSYGYGREADVPTAPAGAAGAGAFSRYELELPLPADVEEVAFGVSVRGQGTAWFDALSIAVVETQHSRPAAPAAIRYLDAALAIMREHSLNRPTVDWPALRTEALEHLRGATDTAGAQLAVRFAVRALGDRHSYLQTAAAGRALRTAAVSNARTGSPAAPPQGRIIDGIGYVAVPSFAGGTQMQQVEFAETLINILQAHDEKGVCGWIVDLRRNTGGNLWPMLAGLGPLLRDGDVAGSLYPGGRRVAVWHRGGQAGFGDYVQLRVRSPYQVRPDLPVGVLTAGATASSAEVLVVAFAGRPHTRSFGAPTRGLSAGNRTFDLPDGASLVLTVAATTDVVGNRVVGSLVPDEIVPTGRGSSAAGEPADAALAASLGWLKASGSCP